MATNSFPGNYRADTQNIGNTYIYQNGGQPYQDNDDEESADEVDKSSSQSVALPFGMQFFHRGVIEGREVTQISFEHFSSIDEHTPNCSDCNCNKKLPRSVVGAKKRRIYVCLNSRCQRLLLCRKCSRKAMDDSRDPHNASHLQQLWQPTWTFDIVTVLQRHLLSSFEVHDMTKYEKIVNFSGLANIGSYAGIGAFSSPLIGALATPVLSFASRLSGETSTPRSTSGPAYNSEAIFCLYIPAPRGRSRISFEVRIEQLVNNQLPAKRISLSNTLRAKNLGQVSFVASACRLSRQPLKTLRRTRQWSVVEHLTVVRWENNDTWRCLCVKLPEIDVEGSNSGIELQVSSQWYKTEFVTGCPFAWHLKSMMLRPETSKIGLATTAQLRRLQVEQQRAEKAGFEADARANRNHERRPRPPTYMENGPKYPR